MTTKLEAINTMLSCIGQAPLNTLDGTKSYFTVLAENILNDEIETIQISGWDFNSEDNYPLNPNIDNNIIISSDILQIKLDSYYGNRYIVRNGKIYDKQEHTFTVDKHLKASVILKIAFENMPIVAQKYITMSAANKFIKRALGSQTVYAYTKEDLMIAKLAMEEHELSLGNYTLISEFYDGDVRRTI